MNNILETENLGIEIIRKELLQKIKINILILRFQTQCY